MLLLLSLLSSQGDDTPNACIQSIRINPTVGYDVVFLSSLFVWSCMISLRTSNFRSFTHSQSTIPATKAMCMCVRSCLNLRAGWICLAAL